MLWAYHNKQFLSFVLKERFHPRAYARGPQLKFDSLFKLKWSFVETFIAQPLQNRLNRVFRFGVAIIFS